jgi:perosamine synthetase
MAAPAFAIQYLGAIPVCIDVDQTWNINPSLIEARITERTKGVIAVHTYGHPANMPEIMSIARKHNLFVLEDCAEAIGSSCHEKLVGTFGEISVFSLYANKIITTGEGGMLTTDSDALAAELRRKRDMYFNLDEDNRFSHEKIGYNYRLTNIQAAIGVSQLSHIQEAIKAKISIAENYISALKAIPNIELPPKEQWATNVYWVFGIVLGEKFPCLRRELRKILREKGIETRPFFSCIHQQPFLANNLSNNKPFPIAERLSEKGLYFPSYISLPDHAYETVAECLFKAQSQHTSFHT